MKRELTEHQTDVLQLLCEGQILHYVDTDDLSLSDGDSNDYHLRRDTFRKLVNLGYIQGGQYASEFAQYYILTKNGEGYLAKYRRDFIKEFVGMSDEEVNQHIRMITGMYAPPLTNQ